MKKLTGYPSIDNIHNSDYSFFSRNPIIPNMSIYNTINLISNFYRKEEAIDCLDLRVNYDEMLKDAITLSKTLKELGIKKGSIWNCCKMLSKTAGGYIWRYADEVNLAT